MSSPLHKEKSASLRVPISSRNILINSLAVPYSIQAAFPVFEGLTLSVKVEAIEGNPTINLFKTIEDDGGRGYLKNNDISYNQIQDAYGQELVTQVGGDWKTIPQTELDTVLARNGTMCLLFEGIEQGKGNIIFKIENDDGVEFELSKVHIHLKEVTDMYETWTVGDALASGVSYNVWPTTSASQTGGSNLAAPISPEEKNYILFIHGWNMAAWEKGAFGSTMFKRLWHQGYKGRFGAYRWPTFYNFGTGLNNSNNPNHFNASEHRAWNSASQLASLVGSLSSTFKGVDGKSLVRCYAHSMGNVVTSEALRLSTESHMHTYISAQAALSADVWDSGVPAMPFPFAIGPTTPNVYGYYWEASATSPPHEWQDEVTCIPLT